MVVLPDLSERVRDLLLVWAAIAIAVALLDERRPARPHTEPTFQDGFVAGYDAAKQEEIPGLTHASQHGRRT